MAKKKQPANPPKPQEFQTKSFSSLKGIAVAAVPATVQEPPKPAVPLNIPDEDDSYVFQQAMGGVRPLVKPEPRPTSPAQKTKPAQIRRQAAVDLANQAEVDAFAQAIGQLKLDVNFADKFPEDDEIKPLGGNRLRQLKKGIIRVDRQLDLHGLTREEALSALTRFIRNARVHGEKAVLVITGKGINSPGEPVLQQAVAAWLREAGKELVAEFDSAPREMGGSGALVVFLKG
ncbi:MAG TPA: Smr/MutS family protein [Desulfuromonadaceae bacterium]|jgi:DNA-nicking Smr family endonuclease